MFFWRFPVALFWLAGAVPLILFLHSLKPKGLQVPTTTLFLWERVLKEQPLGTRLGWLLRKNLLLILQLLAAALLIAALAEPVLRYFGDRSGDLIVVVDLSASMKAKGGKGSRFDAARREWLALIDDLGAAQKMMVIGAGPQPRLLSAFTSDRRRLRDLAREVQPTDAPGAVKEAIQFAHAFLKRGSADRVVVISDGAFTGAAEFAAAGDPLHLIRVSGGKDNLGIVGFAARRAPERPAIIEVMVHVRNFTGASRRVPLNLSLDDRTVASQQIDIGANDRRVVMFSIDGSVNGKLRARLEIDDDFATDNQAYLAVADRAPLRLLYVGPGNPYLERLLSLFSEIAVTRAPVWKPDLQAQAFDAVIFDRVAAPALSHGNFVLIDTLSPNLPLERRGTVQTPRLLAPVAEHPLTSGLKLGDLAIREASRVAVKGPGVALARSSETVLLYALEQRGLRVFFFGFDLLASDLPLRVAFPILWHNIFEWFQPQRLEFPGQSAQAGSAVAIPVFPAADTVAIAAPSGKTETFSEASLPTAFSDTFEAGFYSYRSGNRTGSFAVNLTDENESQIVPPDAWLAGQQKSDARTGPAASGYSLSSALLCAVLVILVVELILALRQGLPARPMIVRAAALAVVVLAWANPRIFRPATALDVLFAVDLSRSVGQEGRDQAQAIIEAAAPVASADVRTGLLAFGRDPEWETLPAEVMPASELALRIDGNATDIQRALQAAMAQIGEGRQGRILLISDGNENRGESARLLPVLRRQGVQVWAVPVNLPRGRNEVYVSDLNLPRVVDSAEGFEVRAVVESLREAAARIRLLRDGAVLGDRELRLHAGSNPIAFHDSLSAPGNHAYELLVEAPEDTLADNNLLQGVVTVRGPPRVLLISAEKQSQQLLSRILQLQGYAVVASSPQAHSMALAALSAYALVVLDNVPAFQLTHAKMENIEKYARDLGGGVLVIGGSQSYGAGGYFRTPLERILPVDMRPPARLEMPHVALLFVIDKSGSMGAGGEGQTKLDLAKAAAIAAADIMNPSDQVGILAFDAAWDWALPFRQVGKGEWISEKLAALQSDGGTDLHKALLEAHRAIGAKQAAIKHVIVLSDGLTDKADFQSLMQQMARDGITVSTVSVGSDADVQLMADIAKTGKGRGYVALDPQTIPQIFTTETLLIARDLLVEKTVKPSIVASVGPLKGVLESSLPSLRGYVLTYPKPRAELLMRVDKDPLLVSWRYGLGQITAFTSDLSGRWGRDWLSWPGLPQWTSQVARDTMRKLVESKMRTELRSEADGTKIVTDLITEDGRFLNQLKVKARLTGPDGPSQEQTLQQSAPGRYEGTFTPTAGGIQFVSLYAESNDAEAPLALGTVPYVVPYPKEYREIKPNLALLSRLAEETGGEMLDGGKFDDGLKRLYTPSPGQGREGHDTWRILAAAALIAFLTDLVLRQWRAPTRADSVAPPRAAEKK